MTSDFPLSEKEQEFLGIVGVFIESVLSELEVRSASDIGEIIRRPAVPIKPVVVADYQNLSITEKNSLIESYHGEFGTAYFVVENPDAPPNLQHPIFDMAEQLVQELNLQHPIDHPMEVHPEAIARFGEPDGTLRLYDLPKEKSTGYREQAETSGLFAAHNDGLGYAGTVQTAFMYLNESPIWGGYTYFSNIVRLAMDLLHTDENAFRSLFLPNAITAIRKRGKGAIKVTSPVLYLDNKTKPHVFFRVSSGEYEIYWRNNIPALDRAMRFLNYHASPFAPGSGFVDFSKKGHGCIMRNRDIVHGRTEFIDGEEKNKKRVLARKWYMTDEIHTIYKHVPGIILLDKFAKLYPEYFGSKILQGEWLYDSDTDTNHQVS